MLYAGSRGQQPSGQADEEAAALRTSKWAVSRAPDHDDLIWETLHVGRYVQTPTAFFPSRRMSCRGVNEWRVVVRAERVLRSVLINSVIFGALFFCTT